MRDSFRHVSHEERYQIDVPTKEGLPLSQIAQPPGRSKSTVGREVGRKIGARGYRPKQS